jgi:hypothetical protein
MPMADTYKEVREFNFPNLKARVFIPDLTPEERAKRMKQIHNQAAKLLQEVTKHE